jgi:DNA repair exonuclease SbcCD ATPase subunit
MQNNPQNPLPSSFSEVTNEAEEHTYDLFNGDNVTVISDGEYTLLDNVPEEIENVVAVSQVEPQTQLLLKQKFAPLFAKFKEWEKMAKTIKVTDISQVDDMKKSKIAAKQVASIRIEADKVRKALKEDSNRYGKAVQSVYNMIEEAITPVEDYLNEQANFLKIQQEKRIAELRVSRGEECKPYSEFVPSYIDLGIISDNDYANVLNGAKLQVEAKLKAEQERVRQEQLTKLHEERSAKIKPYAAHFAGIEILPNLSDYTDVEFAQIQQHLFRAEKKAIAEIEAKEKEAQELLKKKEEEEKRRNKRSSELWPYISFIRDYNALLNAEESEYQKQLKEASNAAIAQQEYNAKVDRELAERTKKLEKEAADLKAKNDAIAAELKRKNAAIEAQAKEKKEAEEKAKQEEAERQASAEKKRKADERKAKNAPDKAKILGLVEQLDKLLVPEVKSDEAKKIINNYCILVDKTKAYLNELAETL